MDYQEDKSAYGEPDEELEEDDFQEEQDDLTESEEEDSPDEEEEEREAEPEEKSHPESRRHWREISPFLLAQVRNENTRDFIENRLIPQMKWYSARASACKRNYQICMTISITLGALIPVAAVMANGATAVKVVIALLGGGVTAVNAYLSMQNYKDLWLSYRNTRENLLRNLYCYFNNAGMFSRELPEAEKDILLVNLCEEELSRETGDWVSVMQNPASLVKHLSKSVFGRRGWR